MRPENTETLVERTAEALGELSMEAQEGAFLGAEDDLLQKLGISRPTLRQAAKIAQNNCLITVRRGIKGGFYAARPDAADAISTLVRFLRIRGASMNHVLSVSRSVSEQAAGLAADCRDPELRQQMMDFAASIDDNDTPETIIRAESTLAKIIAQMSGNPVIELVMAIGYSFGREEQAVALYRLPEDRAQARKLQHDLCRSILYDDADVAALMMRRRSDRVEEWISDAVSKAH